MPKRRCVMGMAASGATLRGGAVCGVTPSGACGGESTACGGASTAVDPVSDPAYNMLNIAKQSVLLEEHLSDDAKYCVDCVSKHFLHMLGLAEEALGLAGARVTDYPHLTTTAPHVRAAFDAWRAAKSDPSVRRHVAEQLRAHRKLLQAAYV